MKQLPKKAKVLALKANGATVIRGLDGRVYIVSKSGAVRPIK